MRVRCTSVCVCACVCVHVCGMGGGGRGMLVSVLIVCIYTVYRGGGRVRCLSDLAYDRISKWKIKVRVYSWDDIISWVSIVRTW